MRYIPIRRMIIRSMFALVFAALATTGCTRKTGPIPVEAKKLPKGTSDGFTSTGSGSSGDSSDFGSGRGFGQESPGEFDNGGDGSFSGDSFGSDFGGADSADAGGTGSFSSSTAGTGDLDPGVDGLDPQIGGSGEDPQIGGASDSGTSGSAGPRIGEQSGSGGFDFGSSSGSGSGLGSGGDLGSGGSGALGGSGLGGSSLDGSASGNGRPGNLFNSNPLPLPGGNGFAQPDMGGIFDPGNQYLGPRVPLEGAPEVDVSWICPNGIEGSCDIAVPGWRLIDP